MQKPGTCARAAALGLAVLLAAPATWAQGDASRMAQARDNSFNPSIGIILNGMFSDYSEDEPDGLEGFQIGHESERPDEGFALDHSEITATGNIDDKFRGGLTLGLESHDGETELELEEAYIQTLPGAGMPAGTRLKVGRALWTFGYLNELHAHADDFADRPLPYRAFLDGAFNDDGAELSIVLPAGGVYGEIGGGLFRGDDTPFAGSDNGQRAWSAFARVGADIGNSAFRIGAYQLNGEARGRTVGDDHGHEDEHGDEHGDEDEEEHGDAELFSVGMFTGDTELFGVDFRFTWAPTGNPRNSELILQGEYFSRSEEGLYSLSEPCEEDEAIHATSTHAHCEDEPHEERLTGDASGWYLQAVYKFLPRWRIGARYSVLSPPDAAELDHDPSATSVMLDWTNSEFGRIRLQYNEESFGPDKDDRQVMLQYVMSLGAHAAHSF